mmetsp:Transcript_20513/g.48941  ORF Transcript_20513/g.48941 Transcript_20513/m.48941 type:complete len:194 (-) Transcript_20513:27-608(-)|eukprot:3936880-Rhodomonas_salina.1
MVVQPKRQDSSSQQPQRMAERQRIPQQQEAPSVWKSWEDGFNTVVGGIQSQANSAVSDLFASAANVVNVIPGAVPRLTTVGENSTTQPHGLSRETSSRSVLSKAQTSSGSERIQRIPANDSRSLGLASRSSGQLTGRSTQSSSSLLAKQAAKNALERKLSRSSTVGRNRERENENCDAATMNKIEMWMQKSQI